MDHIDNLNNHTNTLCCDYTKNTIYTMISFMLMISCMPAFSQLFNHCYENLKEKYKFYKIPMRKITSNDDLLLDECSICLEKYNLKEKIVQLECNHAFHKKCIETWLNKNNSCPQCRENII